MKSLIKLSLIALLFVGFASCSDDDNSGNIEGTSQLMLRLTDAPGDYEKVFVDVEDVILKYNGGLEDVNLDINEGIYDLMELTAGINVLLFDDDVPAGDLSQIRLVLGDENTIVVDGQTFPLATPSAQQSGLKIQVHETLAPGILYEFLLDFDVDKSIVVQGNGDYLLKPVIRASSVAESGAISGTVLPPNVLTLVSAVNDSTEISTYTNDQGAFLLSGVPEGTYQVTLTPDPVSEIPPLVIEDVVVVQTEITDLGEIELIP